VYDLFFLTEKYNSDISYPELRHDFRFSLIIRTKGFSNVMSLKSSNLKSSKSP